LDSAITRQARQTIPQIFAAEGEAGFRERESAALRRVCGEESAVISLGGGALLNETNRTLAESAGRVICLEASLETLVSRTTAQAGSRPLLVADSGSAAARLAELLEQRSTHYNSFPLRLKVTNAVPSVNQRALQVMLGVYQVSGMGHPYRVHIANGAIKNVGHLLSGVVAPSPVLIVADTNTARLYGEVATDSLSGAGFKPSLLTIESGEANKTVGTVEQIWQAARQAKIDRSGMLVALGGGVVGDLTGFAAATWLRGVSWAVVPTTLLAMVDSSLGGKTGADLPQGKNLIGAFHPPAIVISDPEVLHTLPRTELCSGLAEVVKHGVIDDPVLFEDCAALAGRPEAVCGDALFVARAMAVKIRTICADPYEKGVRASLNLGHTIGHGIELAMNFSLTHGAAVAIGMVAVVQLAERLGKLKDLQLSARLSEVLTGLGLPVELPVELDHKACLEAIRLDKKRAAGVVRFVLPRQIGEVETGVEIPENLLREVLYDV